MIAHVELVEAETPLPFIPLAVRVERRENGTFLLLVEGVEPEFCRDRQALLAAILRWSKKGGRDARG